MEYKNILYAGIKKQEDKKEGNQINIRNKDFY